MNGTSALALAKGKIRDWSQQLPACGHPTAGLSLGFLSGPAF